MTMMMMMRCILSVLAVLTAPLLVDAAGVACPYLGDAAPVELALPPSVLSNSIVDLPLKFVGVKHTVRRTNVPHGGSPRVIVQRYSSKPVLEYDPLNGVTVSAAACSDSTESAATSSNGLAVTTAGLVLAAVRNRLDAAVVVTAMGLLATAKAQECTPAVEVLVEAPAAYMGAVETCLAEVSVPGQCPQPFPTFPTCSEVPPECPVAVVGAGTGSLYTTMRLLDEGKIQGSDICIFEMTERVGGRLFSLRGFGPNQDLSVDAGGYRTWPRFTPTIHALITEYLNITMDCYDESEVPCQKFNIVDANGKKAGFATFVEVMMDRLIQAGACYYPYHELDSIEQIKDSSLAQGRQQLPPGFEDVTVLHFTNGVTTTATYTTILGIPQRPLLNILRNSNLPTSVLDAPKLDALHSVQTAIVSKLYLYYPKGSVFWKRLGLDTGDFELDGDARNMLLQGRYHDGHVECDNDNDPTTCHGFLLAVYANDLSGNKAQFFRLYQRDRPEPVTILSNSDLEGARFLQHAHNRLTQYHLYDKTDANYTGFEASSVFGSTSPPQFAVLSTWNVAIPWAGGGWHSWTDLSDIELSMKPFCDNNIFVVNEAYSLLQGWAEGAVKLADEVLAEYFGVSRPWSFPVSDFNQIVQQTNSRECVEADDDSGTTNGGGQVDTGSGGGDAGEVLCFTEDALVLMADGTQKRIVDVETGDYVSTGTGSGAGLVTETLVHPVHTIVPVATIHTAQGDLVGTPDHPILVDKEWMEIAAVAQKKKKKGNNDNLLVSLSRQHVDTFYNLEIDGNVMEESSHSYVVNGVIASGLGDHQQLNERFPRQQVWKNSVAAAAKAA